jgi:hypothetical protein
MLRVISPRIHNLGDFAHCLPVLSGLHKRVEEKLSFVICDRLQRFRGLKELLLAQDIFEEVLFVSELKTGPQQCILLDDTGTDEGYGDRPIAVQKTYTFIRDTFKIDFECDDDFILKFPDVLIYNQWNKIIIGDRWSPKDAPDVDTRRYSNLIEASGCIPKDKAHYLDYTRDLIYNLNLIKYNSKPFVTTFTGIGILADLMKKDLFVLWDEDMRNWQGLPVEHDFDLHYYKNRNGKLKYIKDFKL